MRVAVHCEEPGFLAKPSGCFLKMGSILIVPVRRTRIDLGVYWGPIFMETSQVQQDCSG